ncbi:EAL domain-containing protein [Bacillus salipaludis]|uniref:EAL domain-containing protein n=2 Tax=Bacillus salipaludis TaxID=2547811 RepID=A0A4V3ATZ9_9BACI|nr:EAL domain-containing protein [Bacillus salipaludis]
MNGMVRCYIEKVKRVIQWGKLLLPLASIRYYPPQFNLRNPILEGVSAAFKARHDVAVIVFTIKNYYELSEAEGNFHSSPFIKKMKRVFQNCIEKEMEKNDVIALHDYYEDGITLMIKVDYERHSLSEIDELVNKIIQEVERDLLQQNPPVRPVFDGGYMFVEKHNFSIQSSIERAHRQAIAMAERKIDAELNEMIFTFKKIISKKEIHLWAQPIIDVATSEIHAWEMLTRGPKGVLEDPFPLFSVARQTGMLYDLEMIIFEKIFQQLKATKSRENIFVNCTPLTIGNIRFPRDIKQLLEKYRRISPKQITFEITEHDSIDGVENFTYNLKVLRLMGFRFAVDDTGAGYNSLNTISEIMPDIIKVDRSVIENIHKSPVKESMLKGLLLVAREAGSLVVAEGIENEEEASVLTRNKVDLAQGYYYARPTALVKGIAT